MQDLRVFVAAMEEVGETPLSAAEEARAAAFHHEHDAVAYRAGRRFVRRVLADMLGMAPAAVPLTAPAPGVKPRLAGACGEVGFSLSRCGTYVAVAVGDGEVGVDLEAWTGARAARWMDHLPVDLALSPAEVGAVSALPESSRVRTFAGVWARKEAVVKAAGFGIVGVTPARIGVGTAPLPRMRLTTAPAALPACDDPTGIGPGWSLFAAELADTGAMVAAATYRPGAWSPACRASVVRWRGHPAY